MTEITIATDFAQRGLRVNLAVIRCPVRLSAEPPGLAEAMAAAVTGAERAAAGTPISEWPEIAATRRVYRAFGKDPARYRPAAEALLRRIAQGKGIWRVNPVVDVNNMVSIGSGISIGAFDAARIEGPVILRRAGAGESYAGIGRGPINLEGLPVFADARGPFGSPTSDSERTRVEMETSEVLMVLVGFGEAETVRRAAEVAAEGLARFCRASGPVVELVAG